MTILKDNSKIIRNLSGEILTDSPIIDISSDFGVTKDGGNLVSKVRNRYNSNVFRAASGEEPMEAGNGFLFSQSQKLQGIPFVYNENYIFEMWFKLTSSRTQFIVVQRTAADSNNYFQIYTVSANLTIDIFYNGSGGSVIMNETMPISNGVWHHLLLCYDGVTTSAYLNGVIYKVKGLTIVDYKNTGMSFGSAPHTASNRMGGNIRAIKTSGQISQDLVAWNGALKYAPQAQVFTPPTYPNTLL